MALEKRRREEMASEVNEWKTSRADNVTPTFDSQ